VTDAIARRQAQINRELEGLVAEATALSALACLREELAERGIRMSFTRAARGQIGARISLAGRVLAIRPAVADEQVSELAPVPATEPVCDREPDPEPEQDPIEEDLIEEARRMNYAPAPQMRSPEEARDLRIDARLNSLKASSFWTPRRDLKLVTMLFRGHRTDEVAAELKCTPDDVTKRFKQLLPTVTLDGQKRLMRVLRKRAGEWG